MREIERRAVASAVEVRASSDGKKKKMMGYAAKFNSVSEDLGGFREVLRPGAFDRAIRENQDVLARGEHSAAMLLGRRSSGTLRLSVDEVGLAYEVDLPDTQAARDIATLVERGDVRQSSFAFVVEDGGQRWGNQDGVPLREILDVATLVDVAPVSDPAYRETTVSARAVEEARSLRAAVGAAGLPLFSRERAWDASAAEGRVRAWATTGTGEDERVDWGKYKKAFFYQDTTGDEETALGDFKLGFADVDGGVLKAVPRGIFAVAAVLQGGRGGADISAADKSAIKRKVSAYYRAMASEFEDESIVAPWDAESSSRPPEEEVRAHVTGRALLAAVESRERSLEDFFQAVYAGLCEVLGDPWGEMDGESYGYRWSLEATFQDRVIVETFEGTRKLYQYPMTFDAAGVPSFGEPVEVEEQYVPASASGSSDGTMSVNEARQKLAEVL